MPDTTDRAAAAAATKIFVSYRRGDTAGFVHRLYEDLARKYGREAVFMDLDDIEPGKPFPEEIRAAAASAQVFLVVIGSRWASIEDAEGKRRLDKPGDWVVAEVATALGSGGDVVPVLLEGTGMPAADDLPEAIELLLAHQAVEITPQRWEEDSRRLRKAIDTFLLGRRKRAPLTWALAAAGLAAALTMLAWVTDLTAVPGLNGLERLYERALAVRTPASLGDGTVSIVAVDDRGQGVAERRAEYAELIGVLAESGTSVVAFDAVFDWQRASGESFADRMFAASISGAAESGTAVVLATSGPPQTETIEGRPVQISPVPPWLAEMVGRRWGHVCPEMTPSAGSPFARIEVARLQHDPRAGLGRSGAIWPTLPLRAVQERLGAVSANYDFDDRVIRLCGTAEGTRGGPCGSGRELLLDIPVESVQQPGGGAAGNECSGEGADLLMVSLQLLPERAFGPLTRQAEDEEELASALLPPLVVVGSLRDEPTQELGNLRDYQLHAQTIADLLSGRTARPAGWAVTLLMVLAAAFAGALWRRRNRRPLAISEAPTPYRHWLLSAVDAVVAAAAVTALCYLAALVVFNSWRIVLAVPYVAGAGALAYLLLALAERRRLA